jgi:hypothetical protein
VPALTTDDRPDLVVVSVYATSAYRAYQLADHYRRLGGHVALGGLHVTALPEEAANHTGTVFLGSGRTPGRVCSPTSGGAGRWGATPRASARCWVPRRRRYLCPNSLVVSSWSGSRWTVVSCDRVVRPADPERRWAGLPGSADGWVGAACVVRPVVARRGHHGLAVWVGEHAA